MKNRDMSGWPYWVGFITASNVFIAMLAARDLHALRAWRIDFLPSAAISALTAIIIAIVVIIVCKKLENARLIRHKKATRYETEPDEREYLKKAATELSKVMQRPFKPRDRRKKDNEKQFITNMKSIHAHRKETPTTDSE